MSVSVELQASPGSGCIHAAAMHASGLNISNTALSEPGTGHFRLRIKPDDGREEHKVLFTSEPVSFGVQN